jgi:hypothetical protein
VKGTRQGGALDAEDQKRQALLEGNGVGFVRERLLAQRVQCGLERLYQLPRIADVDAYLEVCAEGEREQLRLREDSDGALEIALMVPALHPVAAEPQTDTLCQIIEGVSHFVYVTHRAALAQKATQLELELQAEVDKYVVLAASAQGPRLDANRCRHLWRALYERIDFEHGPASERGERYRTANDAAARFIRCLEPKFVDRAQTPQLRHTLRTFFHEGLEAKLRMARAA